MADVVRKKIWLKVKRTDLEGAIDSPELFFVEVTEGQKGQEVRENILHTCGLEKLNNIVIKLRNSRDSLIPIGASLVKCNTNSSTRPFLLEVVNVHQNVQPKPRSIKIKSYNDTMKDKMNDIVRRIENLEGIAPNLKEKRNAKIDNEMQEIEQMLVFLQKRIQDSETVSWKGMFKKNPLW